MLYTKWVGLCVQMVKTKHITCVVLFLYDNEVCMPSRCMSVGLGRWCHIFLPVEHHTGLLLWQCRHPKLSTVWLAAAGVL